MKNRVITLFLGAGFSKGISADFPLTKDLLGEIRKKILSKEKIDLGIINRLEAKAIREKKEQPFEEVLKGIYDKKTETEYDYLYRLLVNGVALVTRFMHPGFSRYPDQSMQLGQYIKLLQELDKLGKVRIVTTNYDLISDKAVQWVNDRLLDLKKSINPPKDLRRFQYGVKVSAVWTSDRNLGTIFDTDYFANPSWTESRDLIQIFKLHGSSNWVCCENCGELHLSRIFDDLKKIFSMKENPLCSRCKTPYRYSLVPPMPSKGIDDDFVLAKVWPKAKDSLENSSHIVFIGYSLSEADHSVIQIIKDTYSRIKQYYVMDKDHEIIRKYRRLLGPNLVKEFRTGYSAANLREICDRIRKEPT